MEYETKCFNRASVEVNLMEKYVRDSFRTGYGDSLMKFYSEFLLCPGPGSYLTEVWMYVRGWACTVLYVQYTVIIYVAWIVMLLKLYYKSELIHNICNIRI